MNFLAILISSLLLGCTTTAQYEPCQKCPKLMLYYFPEDEATAQDTAALQRARQVCEAKTGCLTRFYVIEHGRYHAICGYKEKRLCQKPIR